jgi:hypothetical protein
MVTMHSHGVDTVSACPLASKRTVRRATTKSAALGVLTDCGVGHATASQVLPAAGNDVSLIGLGGETSDTLHVEDEQRCDAGWTAANRENV